MNIDVRPEVAAFALLMERKLREHDNKSGWKKCGSTYLRVRALQEMGEFFAAAEIMEGWPPDEAADVANFLMMYLDVTGRLPTLDPEEQAKMDKVAAEVRKQIHSEIEKNKDGRTA